MTVFVGEGGGKRRKEKKGENDEVRLGQEDPTERAVSKAPEKQERATLTGKSRARPAGNRKEEDTPGRKFLEPDYF